MVDIRKKILDSPTGFHAFYSSVHDTPLPDHALKWIEAIYKAREEGKGIVIEAFRGSTKTTTMLTFVAFRIGLEPTKSNLIIQVSDDSAKKNAATVAGIIEFNAGWKMFFKNIVPDKDMGWGGNGYEVQDISVRSKDAGVSSYDEWRRLNSKRQDPTLFAGGRTSHALIGKHPDGVCLLDDLDDETTTRSARESIKTQDLLTGTIFPTYRPETWKIVIGTPWTFKDVISYCKSTGEFLHCNTPVRKDEELTWPNVFTEEEIEKQQKLAGEVEFARMFMLDLEAAKGHILKKEWISYYPFEKIMHDWPLYMGVDYASTQDAIKLGHERDYLAICWGVVSPQRTLVLLDGIMVKISQAEAEQRLIALVGSFPYLKQIGMESIGKGEEYTTLMQRAPVFMPIMPIQSHKGIARSKGGRFEDVLGKMFQFGRIMISDRQTEFTKAFVDQWISWKGKETTSHDDALDAVYMMAKAAEGYIAVPKLQIDPQSSPVFGKRKKVKSPWSSLRDAR